MYHITILFIDLIRRFYVNKAHKGCPGDIGWMIVVDGAGNACPQDRQRPWPVFLYSKHPSVASYANLGEIIFYLLHCFRVATETLRMIAGRFSK